MKYYDNKPEHGVIYDYAQALKEYDRLGVPDGVYYPAVNKLLEGNSIIMSMSSRSTGKTTNWILYGLCIRKVCNPHFQILYFRTTEDELTPMWSKELVKVINEWKDGEYIRKLTDGKFNTLIYHARAFYYAFRDEEGNITAKDFEPCIVCLVVSQEEQYKSSFNAPNGDMILYDEFITTHYIPNSFFHYNNLLKTCFRDRLGGFVVFSANTTNVMSPWFAEMNIARDVRNLQQGQTRDIVSVDGMHIYVEYIKIVEETRKKNRERFNKKFLGWGNSKLNSITGTGSWNFSEYPHIPAEIQEEDLITIVNNIYIDFNTELYRVNICRDNVRGLHLRIHDATRTYDDSKILSLNLDKVASDSRYLYGFGGAKLRKIFDRCIKEKRLYFGTNEVGTGFYEYLYQYQKDR